MMMFFTLLLISVFASVVLYAAMSHLEPDEAPQVDTRPKLSLDPPRFFAGDLARLQSDDVPIPVEVLLRQIERHVRLEQAAAESFLSAPTRESLHVPTASPFVN